MAEICVAFFLKMTVADSNQILASHVCIVYSAMIVYHQSMPITYAKWRMRTSGNFIDRLMVIYKVKLPLAGYWLVIL